MEVVLCEGFPALSPLSLRREKAVEVFTLISRYSKHLRKKNRQKAKKKVIRKPAGDDWF